MITNYLSDLATEIRGEVDDSLVPDNADQLFILYAVLARAKGTAVTETDVHDAWVAWVTMRGDEHENARPFEDLDRATQREDAPFVDAIKRVSARRHSSG